MALQGTIETFALTDVLRLLASTNKTGCLRVTGARGEGRVWVEDGRVVGREASGSRRVETSTEVVFELLRYTEGDFVFEADEVAPEAGAPEDVEPILEQAEAMLEEWKDIEAVVPSLDSWLSLSEDLPEAEVTIDRDRWKLLGIVGGGVTVGALADALDLGELAGSRQAKELIDSGLVNLGDAPVGAASPALDVVAPLEGRDDGPYGSRPPEIADQADYGDQDGQGGLARRTPGAGDFEAFDPGGLIVEDAPVVEDPPVVDEVPVVEDAPVFGSDIDDAEGFGAIDAPAADPSSAPEPADAAEIARQLANLSPKAAKAVASAAKATTQEERERALAEVDDTEDPINRDLLIKFLGSVNS